jgi:hypothetical protein
MVLRRLMLVLVVLMCGRSGLGDEALKLDAALGHIPAEARALVLVDTRMYDLIAPDLSAYVRAASARRKFEIALLPIVGLDDCRPPELRQAIQGWHAARPKVEGIVYVGNIKIPSFFMPRGDVPSSRLWPRYYEDLEMVATRKWQPGPKPGAGPKGPRTPGHDFDQMAHTAAAGPALWAAFLPVGYQDDAQNTYQNWAKQLRLFFHKTAAFYSGAATYGRGMYLISNDISLLQRAKPVWDAVGPKEIEFYSINEKGKDAYRNNPAGYIRANLEKYPSLEAFLDYAGKLPWMDEGWQSPVIFLRHMNESRRRFVWWNVHSNPEYSLITTPQAKAMTGGGLIALLSGCSVGGFKQPGSRSAVDTNTSVERNVLVSVVYGHSAFVAAMGTPHNRVDDECGTPLFAHMYSGGYLGMGHLLRLRQEAKNSGDNMDALRTKQEMLIGDPFVDVN